MSSLVKAELQVLDRKGKATETIPVQFNPTTMQLQMTNSVDGAKSRGRQTQQYNGSSSTQLSIELEFDTADEGTNDNPVDVRTNTDRIRQFVLPGAAGSKQAPPRVRFRWGTFELAGVMNSLGEELSLFSADGVPLRSKLSVQIKEQDAKFEALERGAGANADANPPGSGEGDAAGSGPGSSGSGPIDRAVAALAGETPADFLARNGLPPEAWRGLGAALDALGGGIELEAGVSVGFGASLSAGLGVGVSAGVHVGIGASIGASLGLEAGAAGKAGAAASVQQGFALAAAGGATAAAETAKTIEATASANAARTSFGMPVPPDPAPGGGRGCAPLSAAPTARALAAQPAAPVPPPPRADVRATTFGRGVPLRDRTAVPGADPAGPVVLGRAAPVDLTGRAPGRRAAPWERLTAGAHRVAADREQGARTPACGCHRCDPFRARGARR